jgi:transposase
LVRSTSLHCSPNNSPNRIPADTIHVLDRFHIMKQLGEAIDDVRAAEVKRLKQDGYQPVLKRSRWCLLKREENLTERQTVTLKELL